MATNPYDRTDPTHRDAWEDGYFAGVAAERERCDKAVSALLAKCDANCNRPQKEHSGPSYAAAVGGASATADALAAIRAGEVRG